MKTQTQAHKQTNVYIVHQGRRGETQRHTHQKKMKTMPSHIYKQATMRTFETKSTTQILVEYIKLCLSKQNLCMFHLLGPLDLII